MWGPSSDQPEAAHEIERLLNEAAPHGIGNHVHTVGRCRLFLRLSTASMRCAQVTGLRQLRSVRGGAAQPVAAMPVRRV